MSAPESTPEPIETRWSGALGDLGRGAAGGLTAAVVALGVAELVAAISSSFRSPVIDVGDKVIDLVPSSVKDLAIRWFGTGDKLALLVGIGALLVLYSAVVGTAALGTARRRARPWLGLAGIAAFGVVGAAAALTARDGRGPLAVLPSLAGAVAGAGALVGLVRAAHRAGPEEHHGELSRRSFLAVGATLAAAGVAAGATGRWLGARFSAAASRAAVVLPRPRRALPAVPAEVSVGTAGVTPFVTANRDFYRIDTALQVPQVAVEDWSLRIGGMVERPMVLTFAELTRREVVEADITLTCVSNEVGGGLLGNARWLGVRLDRLLEEAGIRKGANQVVGRSVDGYTCGFPVAALDGGDALVAFGMNGEPLPLEHGFPARLIVPGLYGYVSATKWLTAIELTTFDRFDQYWVPRGWDREAPIKTSSRIDTPRGLEHLRAGTVAVAGVAWAQTRGISAVEVRVDDGPWQRARLAAALNDVTWRQWVHHWEATSGHHTLTVRAIDGTGAIQTDVRSEPMPNGSSGLHQIVVLVD